MEHEFDFKTLGNCIDNGNFFPRSEVNRAIVILVFFWSIKQLFGNQIYNTEERKFSMMWRKILNVFLFYESDEASKKYMFF